jgi:hypothetical protein
MERSGHFAGDTEATVCQGKSECRSYRSYRAYLSGNRSVSCHHKYTKARTSDGVLMEAPAVDLFRRALKAHRDGWFACAMPVGRLSANLKMYTRLTEIATFNIYGVQELSLVIF